MLRISFGQLGRNFGRPLTGNNMIAEKYWKGLKHLPVIHHRFQNVIVENLDAIQCIIDYDSFDTVGYIDPDYIGAYTGIYEHTVDHKDLLDTVFACKGFYAVSNYENPLYESYPWDARKTWQTNVTMQTAAFTDTNNMKGREFLADRNKKVQEILYIKEAGSHA
jgi:site-specific DNA-adenine methylase